MKYNCILLAIALLINGSIYAQEKSTPVKSDGISGIHLRLIYQHPIPVITVNHRDAHINKFGFEGGSVVKVDSTYHLFTSEMNDNPVWVKMRLAHWTSTDKVNWKRIGTVRNHRESSMEKIRALHFGRQWLCGTRLITAGIYFT